MVSFTTRSALRSAATPELYKIRTESTKNRKSVRTDPKKSASGKQKEEVSSAKYVRKARKTENQYVQIRKNQLPGSQKKGGFLQNTYGKLEKQEISTYRFEKISFREAERRGEFCEIRTESTKNRKSVRTDPKKSASGKSKEGRISAKYVRKARKTGNQYVQIRKNQLPGSRKKR